MTEAQNKEKMERQQVPLGAQRKMLRHLEEPAAPVVSLEPAALEMVIPEMLTALVEKTA